ncbi:MAG TPA: SDR family oxidoreductase [Sphingobacteriaceae bacterium]
MSDELFSLNGKVIVITGAAGLLGRHHAEVISRNGGTPVLLDISQKIVDTLSRDLNSRYNVSAIGYEIDITREDDVKKNCDQVIERFGHVDGLINNAANNPKVEGNGQNFSRLENFDLNTWNSDLAVGLTGAFLCSKYYGYAISKQGGAIVNISSDLGLIAPDQRLYHKPGLLPEEQPVKPVTYSVIKSGLIGLTRYLATYWADKNVRCNAICPGGVQNNQDPQFLESINSRIPMGRMARPNEYEGIILYLLSDASSYMTGSIISVDGGRTTW